MGIFRRKRRTALTDDEASPGQLLDDAEPEFEAAGLADEPIDLEDSDAEALPFPQDPPFDRAQGPFDRDEVDQDGSRLDLGALWVPAVDGMQVQLDVNEGAQTVTAVTVGLDGSVAQLQAFAAPRSGPLWPDIRTEIAQSIHAQGGSAQVVDGPLGRELTAKMPKDGPDVRFLGVDGPRWFLRAVISGPATTDDAAAVRLIEAIRGTVVVRGAEAMAPRELLPLRVPTTQTPPSTPEDPARPSQDDLTPFQRGPEITEVR